MAATTAGAGSGYLAAHWWALAIRGVAAIVFAVAAFLIPGITLAVLVMWFGAYALVDGAFSIAAGIRRGVHHQHWWPMLIRGVLGVLVGIFTFARPGMTAVA